MSIAPLTTTEINTLIITQLETSLATSIPLLPKSFLRVLAKVLAAVITILYKYGSFMLLQMFISKASVSETTVNGLTIRPLVEWGRLIGVGDPVAATHAVLTIEITVTSQTGTLPSGSQLVGSGNGVTYLTLSDVALSAETVQVNVRAVSDTSGGSGAGALGNLDTGSTLPFVNPLANVIKDTVVVDTVITGADAEADDAYRARVIDRFQKVPQGGAYADYEQWAEEAAGIINAYPYSGDCPGQIDIYLEATEASSGSSDGIPTDAQLQEVLDNYINVDSAGLASRRPVNALVNTFPISRAAFAVTVVGIADVDNLASAQDDIAVALDAYFANRAPYIPGLTLPPRQDRVTVAGVSGIVDEIVSARGGIFQQVLVTHIDATSSANAEYASVSASVSSEISSLQDFKFSDNGLKAFGLDSSGVIYEYDLTSPLDIATMTYSGNSLNVSASIPTTRGFCFGSDGEMLFIVGDNAAIFGWDLAAAFSLSGTATIQDSFLDTSLFESAPKAIEFSDTGYAIFVAGDSGTLFQINLLSAFVPYTGAYYGFRYPTGYAITGFSFYTGGRKLSVLSDTGVVRNFIVGIPYDLSYGVENAFEVFTVSAEDATPTVIIRDGIILAGGSTSNAVYLYEISEVAVSLDLTPYTLARGEKAKITEVIFE